MFVFYLNEQTPVFSFYKDLPKSVAINDISYINDGRYKHQLDLYLPKYVDKFPVVIFVHGGYWRSGDRDYYQTFTGIHGNIGTTLARQGIGTAVISYKLYPEAGIDEQISDVELASKWVIENISKYGGDARNIFIVGHSAGGHLASMVGLDPKISGKLNGIIAMSSIFSIEDMARDNDDEFNKDISYKMFGNDPRNWKKYSPVTYYTPSSPAMMILLAEKDFDYMLKQVPMYADKIKNLNPNSEYVSIPHYIHSDMVAKFGKKDDLVAPIVTSFIKRHIRK